MPTVSLRVVLLIGFVIAMPILALPAVARRLDDWLYGPPQNEIAHSPLRHELNQTIELQLAERESPASFDQIDPATAVRREPHEGLDSIAPDPPPLSPLPVFGPLTVRSTEPATELAPLDAQSESRLVQIRQELEKLGAEYILLETTDDSNQYRFHCQLRLDPRTPYTRAFEATGSDPLGAAEKVLGEVSQWRSASRPRNTRSE
jgi:hypothetical protein